MYTCPICKTKSHLFDCVDFNTSCNRDLNIEISGTAIYYARCTSCEFMWAPEIYKWTPDNFKKRIYNELYTRHDPDHISRRPELTADALVRQYSGVKHLFRHLDYGGGNGVCSSILTKNGFDSTSYDPFYNNIRPEGKFGIISCVEVFEHVPDPQFLMKDLAELLEPNGMITFTTLLQQQDPKQRITWWYAAPRNGHISLFSKKSISLLAKQHGLTYRIQPGNSHSLHHTNGELEKDYEKL